MDVDLALELNKLVHDECKDAPHDIGIRLIRIVEKRYEAINYSQCCDKLPQDPIVLARYLHEAYEMIAKKQNWNTQENCKVDFSDLPVVNKNTMILLAGKLILDFGGN